MPPLPIEPVLPALREALRAGTSAVLQAPPGAGKTTRVPLALLGEPWLRGQRIVMLEPRRLAARAAARYMADTLGERVGDTVGYRVRLDTRVGPATRVEVVTEGVLTRMLQEDPSLEGTGLVIFDEFHERSVHADLGLALCLQARAVLREELRVLVMSATLDGGPIAALLGGAPVVTSEGRGFPVETRYFHEHPAVRAGPDTGVAAAVREALGREPAGDVLAFLPGEREIARAQERLTSDADGLPAGVFVAPLFGSLSLAEQDRAVAPAPPGRRKVVLATSIAQTSLTIEGVRVVIDSGYSRVPRFSPVSGMTRLETVRVSRATAEQRRGRAGRVAPGVCYRLWPEQENHHLLPHDTPEILAADLAPLALELAAAGVLDPAELAWLDPPPAAAFGQARELLAQLGALGPDGRITAHGRRMAALAMHPRVAHMVLEGRRIGLGALACDVAALLGERDVLDAPDEADLRLRVDAVRGGGARGDAPRFYGVDRGALQRAREQAREWRRQLAPTARERGGAAEASGDVESTGLLLALAYPDRVAQRRPGGAQRFLLRNGGGAVFARPQALGESPYIVAAELDGRRPESRIFRAAPVALAELEAEFAEQIEDEEVVEWDDAAGAVQARRRRRLGAIVLADVPLRNPDPAAIAAAMLGAVARAGVAALPWSDGARRVRERLAFLHRLEPARWPDVSDGALAASLEQWLAPQLAGVRRREEIARVDLAGALLALVPWPQRAALDELAPTHVTVPTGSQIRIDYADPESPVLAVRLQELFGLAETPRIARGAVPLTLHLLSPAHRPVQVTRDLAGFWRGSYFDVRKDMRGRYPRHYWPENPLEAEPTRRAKPKG